LAVFFVFSKPFVNLQVISESGEINSEDCLL